MRVSTSSDSDTGLVAITLADEQGARPNGARPTDAYPAVPMSPRHLARGRRAGRACVGNRRDARAVSALGVLSVHVPPGAG